MHHTILYSWDIQESYTIVTQQKQVDYVNLWPIMWVASVAQTLFNSPMTVLNIIQLLYFRSLACINFLYTINTYISLLWKARAIKKTNTDQKTNGKSCKGSYHPLNEWNIMYIYEPFHPTTTKRVAYTVVGKVEPIGTCDVRCRVWHQVYDDQRVQN